MVQQIRIPKDLVPLVEIDGRHFFFIASKFEFQCAVCLNIMQVVPNKKNGKPRVLYINPDCWCTRQKGEETSGPIKAMTPDDFVAEKEKGLRTRIKDLTANE